MNTQVEALSSSRKEEFTPATLRALIKQSLGYNNRQVTVSCGHSLTYLTITVRDAAVDVRKVKEFAKQCDTWNMDITDYVTGQSVTVKTTKEVDVIHAAPFIEEMKTAWEKIVRADQGTKLSNGYFLWLSVQGYYVTAGLNGARGAYIRTDDVQAGSDWAIEALALQMARL